MIESVQPTGRDVSVEHGRLSEVASTALGSDVRVVIVRDDDGRHFAAPVVGNATSRAEPGDGAAEALVRSVVDRADLGSGFEIARWDGHACDGETRVTVDQTNESVIVGDSAVVKWTIELEPGPHPAPQRLATLVSTGFKGMPRPWGVLTWRRSPEDSPRLVATVTEYVPGASDGWAWAVGDVRTALSTGSDDRVRTSAERLGTLIGELHAALATAGRSELSSESAAQLAADAHRELDDAIRLTSGVQGERLRGRADELHASLDGLRDAAGCTLIEVHGDLHVGQILRAGDRYAVNDFDGNPVLEPAERLRRQVAATDVAGMLQSLDNVGHVVVRRTDGVGPASVTRLTRMARYAFAGAYNAALVGHDATDLLDEGLLLPLRVRQIC
ncbi:MAG: aminoglycoside phosphotransferase, partial [Actinomycetia bacterium]|nr:aminoglycoside phosphotransferase [Actinomycetes bacterium]